MFFHSTDMELVAVVNLVRWGRSLNANNDIINEDDRRYNDKGNICG